MPEWLKKIISPFTGENKEESGLPLTTKNLNKPPVTNAVTIPVNPPSPPLGATAIQVAPSMGGTGGARRRRRSSRKNRTTKRKANRKNRSSRKSRRCMYRKK
jgi:hypothetical protein